MRSIGAFIGFQWNISGWLIILVTYYIATISPAYLWCKVVYDIFFFCMFLTTSVLESCFPKSTQCLVCYAIKSLWHSAWIFLLYLLQVTEVWASWKCKHMLDYFQMHQPMLGWLTATNSIEMVMDDHYFCRRNMVNVWELIIYH